MALCTEVVHELADRDHEDEDEAHREHRENDLAAFLGGVCQEQERGEHRAVTLLHAEVVRETCALDSSVAGGGSRELCERRSVPMLAQLQAGSIECALTE